MQANNYIFTTEGHPIRIGHPALQEPAQATMSPLSGLNQDGSSPGAPQNAEGARSAGHLRKETHCSGIAEAEQQQMFQEETLADGSTAVVRKQHRADRESESRRPLLPSALDRRICPEPVQVRIFASQGVLPHVRLLLSHMCLYSLLHDL